MKHAFINVHVCSYWAHNYKLYKSLSSVFTFLFVFFVKMSVCSTFSVTQGGLNWRRRNYFSLVMLIFNGVQRKQTLGETHSVWSGKWLHPLFILFVIGQYSLQLHEMKNKGIRKRIKYITKLVKQDWIHLITLVFIGTRPHCLSTTVELLASNHKLSTFFNQLTG